MPTLAVIGAGPGMGLAIARTFGSHAFSVALISRNPDNLEILTTRLADDGITAAAFPADVRHPDTLTRALTDAADHFGHIDVLEYSPLVQAPGPEFTMTSPSRSTVADLQQQMEFSLYGAVTATHAVLPAMREAGSGTLLFTTCGSAPNPLLANVQVAEAALRNWALNLHEELAGTGVQAAHVAINAWLGDGGPEDLPSAAIPDQIAPLYWDLHTSPNTAEHIFNGRAPRGTV